MDIVKLIEQQLENQTNQEQEIIDQWGSLENYQWYQKGFHDGYDPKEIEFDWKWSEEAIIKKYGSVENYYLYAEGFHKGLHTEKGLYQTMLKEYLDSSELEYQQILDEVNLFMIHLEAKS